MSEWEEKLNTLLSDPDAMAQVMNMAQNLSQQMGQSGGSAPPPPPAGAIGILGIQILATANLEGTIQPVEKCRGEKKTCAAMVQKLLEADYHGGKVRIHHAENPEAAGALAASLRGHFPEADIEIRPCRGLCSYYAERGGVIVGFETM